MSDHRRSKEGRTFFFTVVTHQRRPILKTDTGRSTLRTAIRETQKDRPFQITAIVFLPEHLHTVWMLPCGDADYAGGKPVATSLVSFLECMILSHELGYREFQTGKLS